jgi:hypothetical protein
MSFLTTPMRISSKLRDLIGTQDGELISRFDAIKLIYIFIRTYNLNLNNGGRNIITTGEFGDNLKSILLIKTDDLTPFNLPKRIMHNFYRPKYIRLAKKMTVLYYKAKANKAFLDIFSKIKYNPGNSGYLTAHKSYIQTTSIRYIRY